MGYLTPLFRDFNKYKDTVPCYITCVQCVYIECVCVGGGGGGGERERERELELELENFIFQGL